MLVAKLEVLSMASLEKEFNYFLDNQDMLVEKYNGKFIVIKDCHVLGAYQSDMEAIMETKKMYELGTFLVRYCSPGDSSYTAHFYSRVAFV